MMTREEIDSALDALLMFHEDAGDSDPEEVQDLVALLRKYHGDIVDLIDSNENNH